MNRSLQSLTKLIIETCQHPPGSRERQKNLTKIIKLVGKQLWRENTSYYEDALQDTWVYFCRNICEGKAKSVYDPNKASVVTWLNNYLKWRLKDGYLRIQKQRSQIAAPRPDKNNQLIDPIDNIPARSDIPPLLEEIEHWALTDTQNKLRRTHIEDRPQITAQALILKRLPPETPWHQLASEYDVAAGTLSSFYQRKCKPLLLEFSKSQGYI